MPTKDLYSALQKIASETSGQTTQNDTGNSDLIDQQDIAKIRSTVDVATKMYPNNKENRFNYWKRSLTLDGMSNNARNVYWKQYEELHPDGIEGAKSDFINVTMNELGYIRGASNKEFMLRDRIANSPPWARSVLEPELAKYSTIVATSNFSKANEVYGKELQSRINKFVINNDLDPDVSADQHTSDMLKLEQLNLGEVASVVNGRIGAYTNTGQFIPGFAIADRNQIFPNDPAGTPSAAEQLLVRDSATHPIKQAVSMKLTHQRSDISRQERLASMGVSGLLESGYYPIDRWGEAFALNPEAPSQAQVISGLRGEIAAGRITHEDQLIESIYTAMNKYPNMFGDLNG